MEGIPGFNFEYNDHMVEKEPTPDRGPKPMSTLESEELRRAKMARDAMAPFQNTAARRAARKSGAIRNEIVSQNAAARSDKRALRAKDGMPLKVPYRVRLITAPEEPERF